MSPGGYSVMPCRSHVAGQFEPCLGTHSSDLGCIPGSGVCDAAGNK